jgi:dTDP-4-dehydrorhamnose reductase
VRKILVKGANSQLGSELREVSSFVNQYKWIFTDWQGLDLSDLQNLEDNIATISPDIIIDYTAYTAVDKAEEEEEF